jgi:sugar phosphate isomerase/epimerase
MRHLGYDVTVELIEGETTRLNVVGEGEEREALGALIGAPLWDIYDLIKDFDPKEIALAYDIRHAAVEGGLSWPIQFNLVKSHIGAVFVKDCAWENGKLKNVPLGEGMVDKKFFVMLQETNFTGPISIHVEYLDRSKDKKVLAEAFRKDLATLKSLLE